MPPQPARLARIIGAAVLTASMAAPVLPAPTPPTRPHGNDTPPPGVSLYHRPTLEELQARTTLRSPSPRLRGLAALEQATSAATPAAPAAVPCIGDGTLGNRV